MKDGAVTSRAYTGPQDLHAMIGLIKDRPFDRATDFPGIVDLQEMLGVPGIQACTQLWFDQHGQLACFAILDGDPSSASVIFEVASGWKGKALDEKVIAWAEASIQKSHPAHEGIFLLETSADSAKPDHITLLERLGFERTGGGAVHMERSLVDPIKKPQLPAGYIIRPIQGESEATDWVRLHRAALGTENMTPEYKLAMMRTPHYDPEMDLVAAAPVGALAAYCVTFINVEENAITGQRNGYTDPIATHPDFQRRGLAKALMLTGLSLLKERNMDSARLGTDSGNIAMIRTAESVGFRITKRIIRFSKSIHFG
jgi:mycothiol synthase